MTVIGPGYINRGSIFARSKSREEVAVSVPSRLSDSIDMSLYSFVECTALDVMQSFCTWTTYDLDARLEQFRVWAEKQIHLCIGESVFELQA